MTTSYDFLLTVLTRANTDLAEARGIARELARDKCLAVGTLHSIGESGELLSAVLNEVRLLHAAINNRQAVMG